MTHLCHCTLPPHEWDPGEAACPDVRWTREMRAAADAGDTVYFAGLGTQDADVLGDAAAVADGSGDGISPPNDGILSRALDEINKRLSWNVAAYGTAWTGEYEDTRFIAEQAILDAIRETRGGMR